MNVTVPPLPANQTGWRKTVTGITDTQGGNCVTGEFLNPGDVVDAPDDTIVVAVDKKLVRWDFGHRSSNRVPVYEVDVSVYVADGSRLALRWTRHFKTAKSAFGPTSRKELSKLLAAHPAPSGTVAVVEEACRPNRREGKCRWCGRRVAAEIGHVVGHGDAAEVEHWKACPTKEAHVGTVEIGVTCGLCGVVLITEGGYRAPDTFALTMVREGEGRWEARHAPHVRCTEARPEGADEARARVAAARQAEQEAYRAKRAAEEEKDRKAAERKAARLAKEKAAEAAENARVAGLARTATQATTLNDKGIGGGERIRLDEHLDTLSDGSTTTRWSVVRYYESGGYGLSVDGCDAPADEAREFTSKRVAQTAYRKVEWTPARRPDSAGSADTCANGCGGTGRHVRYDSSGIKGRVCNRCDQEPDYILSFA